MRKFSLKTYDDHKWNIQEVALQNIALPHNMHLVYKNISTHHKIPRGIKAYQNKKPCQREGKRSWVLESSLTKISN